MKVAQFMFLFIPYVILLFSDEFYKNVWRNGVARSCNICTFSGTREDWYNTKRRLLWRI